MAANLNKTQTVVLQAMRLAAEADGASGHTITDVERAYRAVAGRAATGCRVGVALLQLARLGLVDEITVTGMGGSSRCFRLTERS